jgi:hypothetical protein
LPLFQRISAALRGAPVERGVPRFSLRELNGVDGRVIRLLEKKEIAAFVHNANRYFNV